MKSRIAVLISLIFIHQLATGCAVLFQPEDETALSESANNDDNATTPTYSLSYDPGSYAGALGIAITDLTLTTDMDNPTFSVDLTLPTGLSLDSDTGTISGTPTAGSALTTYTITATDPDGYTVSDEIQIQIINGFYINSTADTSDLDDSDGVCDIGGSVCTIRAAIEENNNPAGGGPSDIYIPDGTYTLAALPWVTYDSAVIVGESRDGVLLDAKGIDFVDNSDSGPTMSLSNMTISNDNVGTYLQDTTQGTPMTVNITNVKYLNNPALTDGGGLKFQDTRTTTANVTDCIFEGNSSTGGGGAIHVQPGAGYSTTINITRTLFKDNFAVTGGAIKTQYNTATIDITCVDCEFDGNYATGAFTGHAIDHNSLGTITIERSLFTGTNYILNDNAVIYNQYGTIDFINSTMSGNNARGFSEQGGTTNISNSTIYDNHSPSSAGTSTGGVYLSGATVNIDNSIVFGNTKDDGGGGTTPDNCHNAAGTLNSNNYNLSDTAAADCNFVAGQDQPGVTDSELNLEALADNGGYTMTHALGTGSFALDVNNTAACGTTITEDQRSVARPQNGNCDIGAFEKE